MPKKLGPSIFVTILAIIALLPTGTASKVNPLGYNSLCSFAPFSSIILLVIGGVLFFTSRKKNTDDDVEM